MGTEWRAGAVSQQSLWRHSASDSSRQRVFTQCWLRGDNSARAAPSQLDKPCQRTPGMRGLLRLYRPHLSLHSGPIASGGLHCVALPRQHFRPIVAASLPRRRVGRVYQPGDGRVTRICSTWFSPSSAIAQRPVANVFTCLGLCIQCQTDNCPLPIDRSRSARDGYG